MKKRVTRVDGITMLLLAAMCATIIGTAVLCGGRTVKADSGTDIIPYTREDGSGTRGAFISMTGLEERNFLGELMDDTAEDIAVIGSSEEMMIQVANTQNGLGYVSYAVAKDSDAVKMLKVDGVLPTIDQCAGRRIYAGESKRQSRGRKLGFGNRNDGCPGWEFQFWHGFKRFEEL